MSKSPWIHVYKALPPELLRQIAPAANDGAWHLEGLRLNIGGGVSTDQRWGQVLASLNSKNTVSNSARQFIRPLVHGLVRDTNGVSGGLN